MKALLSLIICAFALPALAGQGAYFKGGLGYLISGETDLKAKALGMSDSDSIDLDGAFLHPLLLAYGMHMSETASIEFELTHRSGEYDDTGDDSVDFKTLLIGVNGIFNMHLDGSPVKPYIGAGLAIGQYELGELDDEFGAGLQILAGADFLINQKSSFGLELRHHLQIVAPEPSETFDDLGTPVKIEYEAENSMTELLFTYKVSI